MNNPRVIDQSVISAAISDLDGIQQAVNDRGVLVPNGTPVAQYPDRIRAIGSHWLRPPDWIPIDVVDANSITFTVADAGNAAISLAVTNSVAGTQYSVDWGDGTPVTTAASAAAVQHTYVKGAGKPCSRGYTSFKAVIKPVGAAAITKLQFRFPNAPNPGGGPSLGILELNANVDTLTNMDSMFNASTSPAFNCYMLENLIFSGSTAGVTSMTYAFNYCYRLARISGFNASGVANMQQAFYSCVSLTELPALNLASATNLTNTFVSCNSLAGMLDLSSGTKITALNASNCYNLDRVIVSNQAPFTGSTPQINLNYTGLSADALNALFDSLPAVTANQAVSVTGTPGAAACDKTRATAKGWSVTG